MKRRFFNTEGPVNLDEHYGIPPLSRLDMAELTALVKDKRYFILHAPRQTGKTSALGAWADHLNATGQYRAMYFNVEPGQANRNEWDKALIALGDGFMRQLRADRTDTEPMWRFNPDLREPQNRTLMNLIEAWAGCAPRPGVLLLDEVDALVGDTLIGLLRELRSGYRNRPQTFPSTVVLCGVRDVRDYRFTDGGGQIITGGSAFNIKAESLTIGNFSKSEVVALLTQHTEATGRVFESAALDLVYTLTEGQPWLVNALAKRVVEKIAPDAERYTTDHVNEAKERLIMDRTVHLDQLAFRLEEKRVARIIGPLLAGETNWNEDALRDDLQYVKDLGLLVGNPPRIANPIYREVLPRELTYMAQAAITSQEPEWYIKPDGSLDLPKLLHAYGDYHRQHIEAWSRRERYPEIAHQLLLQAFLQRLINGGGMIEREYPTGSGRTDLVIKWRRREGGYEAKVIELKVVRAKDSLETVAADGEVQTRNYMARLGAKEGHLILFDARNPDRPFAEPSEPIDRGEGLWRWTL